MREHKYKHYNVVTIEKSSVNINMVVMTSNQTVSVKHVLWHSFSRVIFAVKVLLNLSIGEVRYLRK